MTRSLQNPYQTTTTTTTSPHSSNKSPSRYMTSSSTTTSPWMIVFIRILFILLLLFLLPKLVDGTILQGQVHPLTNSSFQSIHNSNNNNYKNNKKIKKKKSIPIRKQIQWIRTYCRDQICHSTTTTTTTKPTNNTTVITTTIREEIMNCILICMSPACYEFIYGIQPLEDGEIDMRRGIQYETCIQQEYKRTNKKNRRHA